MVLLLGCAGCDSTPANTREQLLKTARHQDSNFPNGKSVKLTRFAPIGEVTIQGHKVHLVYASSVIPDMPAPRGNSWLYFIEGTDRLLSRQPIDGQPLWCDGSRVYFFGVQSNGETSGNALDLSAGIDKPKYVSSPVAGSWLPSVDQ
jgi:hypothetical protein